MSRRAAHAALLLMLASALAACDNAPSLQERLDALLPQRTASESASFVMQQIATQTPPGNQNLAQAWAGAWQGYITVDDGSAPVSGVATASGLMLLISGPSSFTLDQVVVAADRFTARLSLPGGLGTRLVSGRFEPGLFDGVILPNGWTLDDYLGGRLATDAERLQFGRLALVPDTTPVARPALAELATRDIVSTPAGSFAYALDANGNLALIAPGCQLAGAMAPSPSVGGYYEVALTALGAQCDAQGDAVGVARLLNDDILEVWLRAGDQTLTLPVALP